MKAIKEQKRIRRHARIRAKVAGTLARPRLSVFRSNRFIFAQIIDDENGRTLAAVSDRENHRENENEKKKNAGGAQKKKVDRAKSAGILLAARAKEKKITKVVFDRGGFIYAGRVRALAEGAREGGLDF